MTRFLILLLLLATITRYNYNSGLTASGKVPKVGMVASCDRTIKFGTKVIIDGFTYTVEDRTAKWIAKKYGQCFDIYDDRDTKTLLQWGKKIKEVKIL